MAEALASHRGVLGAALAGAAAAATPIYDRDWGWHLATFRRMRDELALPRDDVFAYASQGAYEPVHWLFQLLLGGLVELCGLAGLAVYRLGFSALFAAALFVVLRRAGARGWGAALALGWVLVGAWERLLVRPHLVSFVGVVVTLGVLLAWRRRRRAAWPLVPLFLVWANAHPGVLFGVLLALGFVLAESAQAWWRGAPLGEHVRLAGWVALAVLATGLNPLGYELYPYLVAHRDMQHTIDVAELRGLFERPERGVRWHLLVCWLYCAGVAIYALRVRGLLSWAWLAACALAVCAAVVSAPATAPFLLPLAGLLGVGLALSVRRGRRGQVDLTLVGATVAFGVLGVIVSREAPLALALLAVLVAPRLPRARDSRLAGVAAASALSLIALAAGVRTLDGGWGLRVGAGLYPRAAADWVLERRPAGPLYNTNGIGGYLAYRLWPRYQVFSDGRMPMFLEALGLPFDQVEARYAPQLVLIDWGLDWRRAHYFELEPEFHARYALVFVGAGGKVYVRRDGPNAALARRWGYRHLGFRHRYYPGLGYRPLPAVAPEHAQAYARELERARREAPDCPYLPQ
ncbi:MAG: hypothetical protein KDD82_11505 [Planctomycetes bacterium]|nr:hypothetical protein [Planctomycetota bacterium]